MHIEGEIGMKWKTVWQVVLLMIIAGAISYLISPKYYFHKREGTVSKGNKITGDYFIFDTGARVDKEGKPTGQRGWALIKLTLCPIRGHSDH